jgi:hypothetical protein
MVQAWLGRLAASGLIIAMLGAVAPVAARAQDADLNSLRKHASELFGAERRDLMTTGGRLGVYPRANVPARPDDSDSHMNPSFLVDAGDEVKAASFL